MKTFTSLLKLCKREEGPGRHKGLGSQVAPLTHFMPLVSLNSPENNKKLPSF